MSLLIVITFVNTILIFILFYVFVKGYDAYKMLLDWHTRSVMLFDAEILQLKDEISKEHFEEFIDYVSNTKKFEDMEEMQNVLKKLQELHLKSD